MNIHYFTRRFYLCLLMLILSSRQAYSAQANIIIFSIDTLRADHLSCYDYSRKTSPCIDKFSKDAVLFRNAVSQAPTTVPAHMSLFTSLTPPVHGVNNIKETDKSAQYVEDEKKRLLISQLNPRIKTWAQVLKENGYLTRALHGGGQLSGELGFSRGFDEYDFWNDSLSKAFSMDKVREAIQESKQTKKPLFLFLHHYICHSPYVHAPKEFGSKFLKKTIPGLPNYSGKINYGSNYYEDNEKFWDQVDLSNPEHREQIISLYDGGVYYADYVFGRLMDTLKAEGFYDNSVIVVLSDHGEEFYEHSGKLHWKLFEEILRVPLICKMPDNKFAGITIDRYVRIMDIMPTLLEQLGIKYGHLTQGISFLPLINGNGDYRPTIVSYGQPVASLKTNSNQPSRGTLEWLFDKKTDPREENNLTAKHPEILEKMRRFAQKMNNKGETAVINTEKSNISVPNIDEGLIDMLKSLGYLQ
jgi:arylsulfatase A-like enzyme